MATTEELTANLAEAEAAIHKLMTGRSVVEVRTDTEVVRYHPADLGRLTAYRDDLKRQLGQTTRGAISVGFR